MRGVWIVLASVAVCGTAVASPYEKQCQGGDQKSCALFATELADKFRKKHDVAVGERAYTLLERACNEGVYEGCLFMTNLTMDQSPQTEAFLRRHCESGYAPSCVSLAGWRAKSAPSDSHALLVKACGMVATSKPTALSYQWGGAADACGRLAMSLRATDPTKAAKLDLLWATAMLENYEASFVHQDEEMMRLARDVNASYASDDARSRHQVDWVGAAQTLQRGLGDVAQRYNANVAQAQSIARGYNERQVARAAGRAATSGPPARQPIASFGGAPSNAAAYPGAPPNAAAYPGAPAGRQATTPGSSATTPGSSAPTPQATAAAERDRQLKACMAQPITKTHTSQTNPFMDHAGRYEDLRKAAHACPSANGRENGDPRTSFQACMGMNARSWPDANAQADMDSFGTRAHRVGEPFPYLNPGGTRGHCLTMGQQNCIYALEHNIKGLSEAYNRVQGIWDGEDRNHARDAERARDDECRRRFP